MGLFCLFVFEALIAKIYLGPASFMEVFLEMRRKKRGVGPQLLHDYCFLLIESTLITYFPEQHF